MAYPQYNSVETIDPDAATTGRWKGFMVTTTGTVVFTTSNNETQTMTFVAKDFNVPIPIGVKKFFAASSVTGLFGLN